MYLGDRHINFDRYYDAPDYDDEPETEEEIAAAKAEVEAEAAEWKALEEKWKAADCKCKCGRPITLAEAFHDGICGACIDEAMQKFWSEMSDEEFEAHLVE